MLDKRFDQVVEILADKLQKTDQRSLLSANGPPLTLGA